MAKGKKQDARLVLIFQRGFEVFGGERGILPKTLDHGLVVGNTGSTFH
jgi:hypothetical protein